MIRCLFYITGKPVIASLPVKYQLTSQKSPPILPAVKSSALSNYRAPYDVHVLDSRTHISKPQPQGRLNNDRDRPRPLKPIIDQSSPESSGGTALPPSGEATEATISLSSDDAAVLSRCVFIIPVYNHAAAIAAVINRALAFKRPLFVIDDGSTDATPEALAGLSGITVIRHPVNLGKGAALMTGFAAAAPLADWAITIDADGQHDPNDALALIKAIPAGARPFIVGRRTQMLEKGAPWTSRWGRGFSNFWVWACSGLILSDTQSGFRVYPLPEVLRLNPRGRQFQFEVEVLVLAAWAKMKIIEVDISTRYRLPGQRISHFQPGLDFWRNTAAFSRLLTKRVLLTRKLRAPKMNPSQRKAGRGSFLYP